MSGDDVAGFGWANAPDEFGCVVRVDGPRIVVSVRGEIDLGTAPTLRHALRDAVAEAGTDIVIDLEEVGYIDSAGAQELLVANENAHERSSTLTLHRVNPFVQRTLDLLGLHDTLSVD